MAQAMPLPPGQAAPDEWVPISSRRTVPEVDPQAATGGGSAGDGGVGGASWQLRVAPRHRAVVRRFFGRTSEEGK